MKSVKTHLGVKIFKRKLMVTGSDLRELKDGTMKPCKPQYDICYTYGGSYPYDTIKECVDAIEYLKECCTSDDKEFIEIMNSEY